MKQRDVESLYSVDATVRYVYFYVIRISVIRARRIVKLSDLLSFSSSLSDERESCLYLGAEDGIYFEYNCHVYSAFIYC